MYSFDTTVVVALVLLPITAIAVALVYLLPDHSEVWRRARLRCALVAFSAGMGVGLAAASNVMLASLDNSWWMAVDGALAALFAGVGVLGGLFFAIRLDLYEQYDKKLAP